MHYLEQKTLLKSAWTDLEVLLHYKQTCSLALQRVEMSDNSNEEHLVQNRKRMSYVFYDSMTLHSVGKRNIEDN